MKTFKKLMAVYAVTITVAIAIAVVIAAALCLAGCDSNSGGNAGRGRNSSNAGNNGGGKNATSERNINFTETLSVYNASEYMDMSTVADFEAEFAIKVEYAEFNSNEAMYSDILRNPGGFDVLVPSDYAVDRLIKEGMLAKLDKAKVPNIANVAEEYLKPAYDPGNEYVVPYMAGTLGILYNKRQAAAPVDSWGALSDAQYGGKVLMLDSERDAIGISLKALGYSMNSNDDAELEQAKSKLQAIRSIAAAFNGSEEIRDRLVAGEGVLGVVYSGDAKTAIDRNPDLAYAIPKEGSNKWVDGFVIMADTRHLDAAYKFINFMCKPNIAVRNMSSIGYMSPIKGAWSEFGSNRIMFPSQEELGRCEAFLFDGQSAPKYSKLWSEIR